MYGETIKRIRKSKSMTLKEVAGDALSVSQLSRFENGKSIIPVNHFYTILNNLNTTTEEFQFFLGQKQDRHLLKLFEEIEQLVREENLEELGQLKKELKLKQPAIYSWDQFLIYFIDAIFYIYEGEERSSYQPVLNYLMQVEDWGEMELRLYALFGFVFEVETTHFLMYTALKRSRRYIAVPAAAKLLHAILSNNFSTFLFYDRIDYAEETIDLFDTQYSENMDVILPHVDFIFNKGLLAFKKDNPNKAKEYCEKAIGICDLFRQKNAGELYRQRYELWQKDYKKPQFKELKVTIGFHDMMDGDLDNNKK